VGEIKSDRCKRRVIQIGGENYYLVVGEDFVLATVPRENSPDQSREREVVETLCGVITEILEELREVCSG